MDYLSIKALHIIFVVTWFSGLFYIVRLFIYHVEAEKEDGNTKSILQRQYKIMSKRLWYGITWPSAILTAFFASWLLHKNPALLGQSWMHIKLLFVALLYVYHFCCHRIFMQLQKDVIRYSSFKLRIWNEVTTIILVAIVFLVVLKNTISWVWGVAGIGILALLLFLAIRLYKKLRR